eukprot:g5763.t1
MASLVLEGGASRYHCFMSPLCPFSHAVALVRASCNLCDCLGCSVAEKKDAQGWIFQPVGFAPFNAKRVHVHEVYTACSSSSDGIHGQGASPVSAARTLPVLWDKQERRIVSNDAMAVLRFVHGWAETGHGLYPEELRVSIDAMNARLQSNVLQQIHRVALARSGAQHAELRSALFGELAKLERSLGAQRYVVAPGNTLTESDWLLFAALVRFDTAYFGAFGCDEAKISDRFPHLHHWLRELYQLPGVAATCHGLVYLSFYFALPWTFRKLLHFPASVLTASTLRTELSLPHLRDKRKYPAAGLTGVLTKLTLFMHSVAILAAITYLLDEDLFNGWMSWLAGLLSLRGIQYPDEW